ncbi:UNVERIFIED_CONTAM: hypothetical protein FKN15_047234 [Acipenser sinensis]
MERWERELGLALLKRRVREPTELELLLQKWEQATGAPLTPAPEPEGVELPSQEPEGVELPPQEPEGMELPSQEPEGVELPSQEPEGVELPPREPEGVELPSREPEGVDLPSQEPEGVELPSQEPEGVELPPREPEGVELPSREPEGEEQPPPEREELLWPKLQGEEVKSPPPPQPRPPPLRSSPALLCAVSCPSLLDTLPVCLDLPMLDLEPRSLQDWSQFSTLFPAPLLPSTKTSLHCSQTSLELPLVTTSLPLGVWTSLLRAPAADLCTHLQPPVPRLSLQSPLTNQWGPSLSMRGPYLAGPERGPTHPQVRPWKRAKRDISGLEGGWLCFRGGGGRRMAGVLKRQGGDM